MEYATILGMREFVCLALGIYLGFIIPHEGKLCVIPEPKDCPKEEKIQKSKEELQVESLWEHFNLCVDRLIKCEKDLDYEKSLTKENCYNSEY